MSLNGKTIILTGGSSGIGEQAAIQFASLGAKVCIVARRSDELERVQNIIQQQGGQAWIYPVDITKDDDAQQCIEKILSEHKTVDVLINNAARSIRRPIMEALDRLHDYERTMQINYFAAVRLTLALLPHFLANGHGHVVNVSTMSTQVPIPLFSAYLASKSALESFSRSLKMELGDQGINVSIVYFPMVRTPMSSKTKIYKHMRMLDTETAAGWLVKAVQEKHYRVTSTSGAIANALLNAAPNTVMNLTRPLFKLMDRRLEKKL
ncbi:short-chain dehydrogenase [Acinetobacter sp. COS3]|uniref:SDR family NAD(P)-dependent oxidoreductase n=1 Tax=Acinetobacter sp. COS3 TaxID=1397525 RepID=UPI0003B8C629|nr:SDR family NAD(P)-dependent oxidoreductase [Acinetobacter sp. COS3]ERS01279.1 short-chain dehydrogenase [Acinetobacter sp. COS3]